MYREKIGSLAVLLATVVSAQTVLGEDRVDAQRDQGVRQVQLDLIVFRVNRAEALRLGFRWLDARTGTGAWTLLRDEGGKFADHLKAMRALGIASVEANPRIVTLSGRAAAFAYGVEYAAPVANAPTNPRFIPASAEVRFLPQVLPSGKIKVEVEPNAGAADLKGERPKACVTLTEGQCMAIVGLVLPPADRASEKGTQAILLVTPRLVDPVQNAELMKLTPGREPRSPDDFELFLESILEAPRDPRAAGHVPAYKTPSGGGGCLDGRCGNPAVAPENVGQTPKPPALFPYLPSSPQRRILVPQEGEKLVPTGATRMPEPKPHGSAASPAPSLVPGPISPGLAPPGPPDELSLPAAHSSAFQAEKVGAGVSADERYVAELLEILQQTKSTDAFQLTLTMLVEARADPRRVVPLAIRNGERLGLLGKHLPSDEGRDAYLVNVVSELIRELATGKPAHERSRISSNPQQRVKKLLETSEDLRQIQEEWRRFWATDQPSHLPPERVKGPLSR